MQSKETGSITGLFYLCKSNLINYEKNWIPLSCRTFFGAALL